MSKRIFLTFVAISVLFSSGVLAQGNKQQHRHFDKEAFQAKRNAFITAEVGLTPEEAEVFIPLCNELQKKMFDVGRECRKLTKELKHKESLTESDYSKVNDECIGVKLKEAALEKEYYEKFKKILSPEKLYKYRRAEYKFARNFMKGSDVNKEVNKKK